MLGLPLLWTQTKNLDSFSKRRPAPVRVSHQKPHLWEVLLWIYYGKRWCEIKGFIIYKGLENLGQTKTRARAVHCRYDNRWSEEKEKKNEKEGKCEKVWKKSRSVVDEAQSIWKRKRSDWMMDALDCWVENDGYDSIRSARTPKTDLSGKHREMGLMWCDSELKVKVG